MIKTPSITLTIAGSDSFGGAGIQADIKTFTALKVYSMSIITSITAQNSFSIKKIKNTNKEIFDLQIHSCLEDIIPDSIKIGMLPSKFMPDIIKKYFKKYKLKNLVIDPVMISKSMVKLCDDNVANEIKEKLFPLAEIITPNKEEAEFLSKVKIKNKEDIIKVFKKLSSYGPKSILIKGGHFKGDIVRDYFYKEGKIKVFENKKIKTKNTHGTGCTLSSAISAFLAKGENIENSCEKAISYVNNAIKFSLNIGKGNGPLNHFFK